MKVTLLYLLAYALCASAQLVDLSRELICPDSNPAHCYPKVFVPSDNWQEIKEDQQIPPGLHVRVNLETGKREAKLNEDTKHTPELMVVEQPDELGAKMKEANDDMSQKIQDSIKKYKKQRNSFMRSKVSQSELIDFSSSVEEVLGFREGSNIDRLEKALDTLTELSHDIEFGVRLTKNPEIFNSLLRVADLAADEQQITEKAYRIMGSALRNNPDAVDNVLEKQPRAFIAELFEVLASGPADVIQKRILGVIQGLTTDKNFAYHYFNGEDLTNSWGLDKLIAIFPTVGVSAKERIINMLEDLNIIQDTPSSQFDKRTMEITVKPNYKVAKLLQNFLVDRKFVSEAQFQSAFNTLVNLHKSTNLESSKEFMQWLSEEVELRKAGNRPRDKVYSGRDAAFDKSMLEARYMVFGNPNGYRKAYVDDEF